MDVGIICVDLSLILSLQLEMTDGSTNLSEAFLALSFPQSQQPVMDHARLCMIRTVTIQGVCSTEEICSASCRKRQNAHS